MRSQHQTTPLQPTRPASTTRRIEPKRCGLDAEVKDSGEGLTKPTDRHPGRNRFAQGHRSGSPYHRAPYSHWFWGYACGTDIGWLVRWLRRYVNALPSTMVGITARANVQKAECRTKIPKAANPMFPSQVVSVDVHDMKPPSSRTDSSSPLSPPKK